MILQPAEDTQRFQLDNLLMYCIYQYLLMQRQLLIMLSIILDLTTYNPILIGRSAKRCRQLLPIWYLKGVLVSRRMLKNSTFFMSNLLPNKLKKLPTCFSGFNFWPLFPIIRTDKVFRGTLYTNRPVLSHDVYCGRITIVTRQALLDYSCNTVVWWQRCKMPVVTTMAVAS